MLSYLFLQRNQILWMAIALEESLWPDRKLSLYCGAAAPVHNWTWEVPVVWVVGVLPSAWIVQLTLPMWIGVCTSTAHDFAHSNPAK